MNHTPGRQRGLGDIPLTLKKKSSIITIYKIMTK